MVMARKRVSDLDNAGSCLGYGRTLGITAALPVKQR